MEIQSIKVGSLSTNCYFLTSENEIVIIDPGEDSEKVIEKIKEKKRKVKYIILTHYHPDHTQEAQKIKDFFDSEIIAHREDVGFLNFSGIGVDKLVEDKEKINFGNSSLEVIHTPGHTEGSICLAGNGFIITGDTLFEDGWGRTDLPGGSSYKMKKSLEKIKNFVNQKTKIYPGHGNSFYIE